MAGDAPEGAAFARRRLWPGDVAFALAYGAAVGVAALLGALWLRRGVSEEIALVTGFFTSGAIAAGFAVAAVLGRRMETASIGRRFAAALVGLMLVTTGSHVLILFAEYSGYYAQWWPSGFGGQLRSAASTLGGVGFYYVSIGLPILLPFGFPVLLFSAFWLARR